MILSFLSKIFKKKNHGQALHASSEGNNNAQKTKKIKTMKKAKPNLPASSMLQSPASSGKMVKKAAAKKVVKAVMKKAAKKK